MKNLVTQISQKLLAQNLRCTVAESCTGGLIAAAMTDIPGSSQWFDCGFVTYSNQSKQTILSVPNTTLESHGAVSEATVLAMVTGALKISGADVGIATSGIAGPGGGSATKPVGTVWIAWAGGITPPTAHCYLFTGNRTAIREQAVQTALSGLVRRL